MQYQNKKKEEEEMNHVSRNDLIGIRENIMCK